METKNPVMAQTRVREAFFRYLFVLQKRKTYSYKNAKNKSFMI